MEQPPAYSEGPEGSTGMAPLSQPWKLRCGRHAPRPYGSELQVPGWQWVGQTAGQPGKIAEQEGFLEEETS